MRGLRRAVGGGMLGMVMLGMPMTGCSDQGPDMDTPTYPQFGDVRAVGDHREIEIQFQSAGAVLTGTLFVPATGSDFAATALNPGSSWDARIPWGDLGGFVQALGVGVFSYDKRGFGASEGTFSLAADTAAFDILAGDLLEASRALAAAPLIRSDRVGVIGTSQGGWIGPLAANRDRQTIRFSIALAGGAISTGQDAVYDELTGYTRCERSEQPMDDILMALREAGPSGFDPRGSLEEMTQPAIWLYGGRDFSHSAEFSVEKLAEIEAVHAKDWTVVVLENANHEMIEGGAICSGVGQPADLVTPLTAWLDDLFPGG